jgi:outer membrane biosynthesis protein TonB
MASNEAGKPGQTSSSVLGSLKTFSLNTWRRLAMLGHYTLICFHQQRQRRAWRHLGQQIHQASESGEANPMLSGEVKDSLSKAQALHASKDRHHQAIAALREKIRASRAEAAPPPQEAEPAPPPPKAEPAAVEPEPAPAPEPEAETAKEPEPEKPQD